MAVRLTLSVPFHGMPHLWNVSANVGPGRECPNNPADVQRVKYLASLNRQWGPTVAASCRWPPIVVNTQFDAVLGFWITVWARAFFGDQNVNLTTIVPAKGDESSIIRLPNELANQLSPASWAEAPAHFDLLPEERSLMTQAVRHGLSRTTTARKRG